MINIYKDCTAKLIIYDQGTSKKIEEHIPKFLMGDIAYAVRKRFRRIIIEEIEIHEIRFTNMMNYCAWGKGHCFVFHDDSPNVFKTKEEAYMYAEKLEHRKNIKFRELKY